MAEYIEREAVLRRMQKIATEAWKMRIKANVETVWNEAQDVLRFFPAADVRPVVRGKWVPVGADDQDEGMFMCSECGSEHFFPELLLNIPADNFCPNCGADMREES